MNFGYRRGGGRGTLGLIKACQFFLFFLGKDGKKYNMKFDWKLNICFCVTVKDSEKFEACVASF